MKDVNGQSEITQSIEEPTREMKTKGRHILLAEARCDEKDNEEYRSERVWTDSERIEITGRSLLDKKGAEKVERDWNVQMI
jgi:hypothetical protein